MKTSVRIVIDTNVLVSGLRSSGGASYLLLSMIEEVGWTVCLSATMVFEYEEQLHKDRIHSGLTAAVVDEFLDVLCASAENISLFYRWRPILRDPDDDVILETAVNGGCSVIVTYNTRDFRGAEQFGIRIQTPKEFLEEQGILQR